MSELFSEGRIYFISEENLINCALLALGNFLGRKGRLSNAVIVSVGTSNVKRACRGKASIEGCHANLIRNPP